MQRLPNRRNLGVQRKGVQRTASPAGFFISTSFHAAGRLSRKLVSPRTPIFIYVPVCRESRSGDGRNFEVFTAGRLDSCRFIIRHWADLTPAGSGRRPLDYYYYCSSANPAAVHDSETRNGRLPQRPRLKSVYRRWAFLIKGHHRGEIAAGWVCGSGLT